MSTKYKGLYNEIVLMKNQQEKLGRHRAFS